MSKLVTIFGGSGFVGRYIARRMAQQGWRVRVAVRRPNEALYVKPYGAPGQVEPILCNIRDDSSVQAALRGADAAVNCVGTFDRSGRNHFGAVHDQAAGRIARFAAAEGVAHLVHISALGASSESPSLYGKSKAAGEKAVLEAFPGAMILRPSVIFGTEDGFFNKFAGMARLGPVLPITHGATLFQPVYVEDVAQAAVLGATGAAAPGIYELGGPEVKPFRDWIAQMLAVIQRRRLVLNLPGFAMAPLAWGLDMVSSLTGGLVANRLLTRDQLVSLTVDNVVQPEAKGFADLGISPMAAEAVMPEYLWPYRSSGQYAAIKASAKNLKKV